MNDANKLYSNKFGRMDGNNVPICRYKYSEDNCRTNKLDGKLIDYERHNNSLIDNNQSSDDYDSLNTTQSTCLNDSIASSTPTTKAVTSRTIIKIPSINETISPILSPNG